EHLVLIRPYDGGLVMHEMYYADEVRAFSEIPTDGAVKLRDTETDLAKKLIEQLSATEFRPEQYRDEYRERLMEAVQKKVAGEEVVAPPAPARAEVIDLMDALKKSLAGRKAGEQADTGARAGKRRPAAAVVRREAAAGRSRGSASSPTASASSPGMARVAGSPSRGSSSSTSTLGAWSPAPRRSPGYRPRRRYRASARNSGAISPWRSRTARRSRRAP